MCESEEENKMKARLQSMLNSTSSAKNASKADVHEQRINKEKADVTSLLHLNRPHLREQVAAVEERMCVLSTGSRIFGPIHFRAGR